MAAAAAYTEHLLSDPVSDPATVINVAPEPICDNATTNAPSNAANNTDASTSEVDDRTCRICLEPQEDPSNPLISPCKCSGSCKFVHRDCLRRWREDALTESSFYQCEICKFKYQYNRLWWGNLLGSVWVVGLVFILVVAATLVGVGYVTNFLITGTKFDFLDPDMALYQRIAVTGFVVVSCASFVYAVSVYLFSLCNFGWAQHHMRQLPLWLQAEYLWGFIFVNYHIWAFILALCLLFGQVWSRCKAAAQGAQYMAENVSG